MSKKGWKAVERVVAKALGTTRMGPTGPTNDAVTTDGEWGVEVKNHKSIPWASVEDWLRLAEKRAREQGQKHAALVVKRSAGAGRPTPYLVVISLETLAELASNN